jgi:hypothetical protein
MADYIVQGETLMTTVAEIQSAVRTLPDEQFKVFSSWFDKYEEEHWDRQIEDDQKSGPLRDLINKARSDFEAGKCGSL